MSLAHRGLKPISTIGAARPHGTRLRYMSGCKCFKCRRANSDYERSRTLARAAGDWNGIVKADRARAHLESLHRAGVGRRTVSDITGISDSILHELRKGRRAGLRARTERKILSVSKRDGQMVPAARAYQLIDQMLGDGFSKAEIARRLGYHTGAIQLNSKRITARNEAKVVALHSKLNI